jgi:hypothetical protein
MHDMEIEEEGHVCSRQEIPSRIGIDSVIEVGDGILIRIDGTRKVVSNSFGEDGPASGLNGEIRTELDEVIIGDSVLIGIFSITCEPVSDGRRKSEETFFE